MDHQTLVSFVWLIPAMPLISFFAILLFTGGKNRLSHTIAIGAMAISFILAQVVFWNVVSNGEELAANPIAQSFPWLPAGATSFNMGVLVDPLTAIMLFMVPLACLMIFIYSVGYSNFNKTRDLRDEPGKPPEHGVEPLYSRFFAFLSLFAAGMLTLVVSDNLLMLFIGWEIMGLCSYLLIGFWYARNYSDPKKITPRGAAVKAFMTTRVGDVFMMLGIVFLYSATGSLSFREVFSAVSTHALATALFIGIPAAQVIFGLLFIGTVGKSAQFPLHVWLPDAMEGPTPVSAMIHAAAMVSAGVYMVIRMFPLLAGTATEGAPTFGVMALIGGFTALFAATIALAQNDIKKVLAYSTISQLGYMIAALGIGAWVAAAFHLITHAFFKALLFMGSGSVIHGVEHGQHALHETHDDHALTTDASAHAEHDHAEHAGPEFDPQDMFNMGGLRKKMPWTFWTFLIGGFALSGFPLITAGFWSKDEILGEAYAHNPIIFWTLALAALLTAFYTARQISLSFLGKARTEAAEHAHESHWTMILPLVILSFFAIFAGFAGTKGDFPFIGLALRPPLVHSSWFESFLEPAITQTGIQLRAASFTFAPFIVSVIVALGGLFLGWLVYGRKPLAAGAPDPLAKLGGVWTLLKNKYYIDELYAAVFVQPVTRFAAWMGDVFDRGVIDGVLHGIGRGAVSVATAFRSFDTSAINGGADALANDVKRFGRWLREIQTGRVQNYLLFVLVSVVLLAALYITLFS